MPKQELTDEQRKELSAKLNALAAAADLDDVTESSSGYVEIPAGYYLCEVTHNEINKSKSGKMQAAFEFKIVEDGRSLDDVKTVIEHTKGEKIRKYYSLEDVKGFKRFVSDMLKFEIDEKGSSLPKEAFENDETINDALDAIEGLNIYIQNSVTKKDDGTLSTWVNLVTWEHAADLELPC